MELSRSALVAQTMIFKVLLLGLSLCNSGIFARKKNYEQLNYMLNGDTRCEGELFESKSTVLWWTLKAANEACAQEDCGSALSAVGSGRSSRHLMQLMDCGDEPYCYYHSVNLRIKCSESVRLVQGPSLCSGTLQLRWNQSWTSVCEGGIDLRDAEVVCRELGCGAPALLQGAPSGVGQVPLGQTFHCEGHESALMNCSRSRSDNCSSGAAAQLTCSELVKLDGQPSRCAGTVLLRHDGQWRPVKSQFELGVENTWNHNMTTAVCRQLHCGSAVSERVKRDSSVKFVWQVLSSCVAESPSLRDCVLHEQELDLGRGMEVVCSDLLFRPNISLSAEADGVLQAEPLGLSILLGSIFSVRCSIQPQYPGGFFQLLSPSLDPSLNHILPAVNHSALFLFSDAGPAHNGSYTCVYHLQVFSHNFFSQSHTLHISVWEENNLGYLLLLIPSALIVVVLFALVLCRRRKTAQKRRHSEDNFGVETYENVGLEQVPADSTYQSLFPETRDLIYEELRPPQLQDSV